MDEVSIIGLDLAKNVFQAHGAYGDGSVAFRKKIARGKLLAFSASLPRCLVAMEACASAHHWVREIGALGHDVRLIAPIHVKPFVGRNKNDATDAQAIAEAASRPAMRFVGVKTADKQASSMAFKTRDLLVRQRTQTINALRGHLAEYGIIAPNGLVHVAALAEVLAAPDARVPEPVITLGRMLLAHVGALGEQIGMLEKELRERAKRDQTAKRLMTICALDGRDQRRRPNYWLGRPVRRPIRSWMGRRGRLPFRSGGLGAWLRDGAGHGVRGSCRHRPPTARGSRLRASRERRLAARLGEDRVRGSAARPRDGAPPLHAEPPRPAIGRVGSSSCWTPRSDTYGWALRRSSPANFVSASPDRLRIVQPSLAAAPIAS